MFSKACKFGRKHKFACEKFIFHSNTHAFLLKPYLIHPHRFLPLLSSPPMMAKKPDRTAFLTDGILDHAAQ